MRLQQTGNSALSTTESRITRPHTLSRRKASKIVRVFPFCVSDTTSASVGVAVNSSGIDNLQYRVAVDVTKILVGDELQYVATTGIESG